jgi:hypothetical protein
VTCNADLAQASNVLKSLDNKVTENQWRREWDSHSDCKVNLTTVRPKGNKHSAISPAARTGHVSDAVLGSYIRKADAFSGVAGSIAHSHKLGRNAAVESYLSRSESNLLPFARILKAPIHCIIP